MTIEAIALRAEVSAQCVYAIFKSKNGILAEILDRSTFTADYGDAVQKALNAGDPETRLRLAARIARQSHGAQSATFDLSRGMGVVAPELAKLELQREHLRYEREEVMIRLLRDSGSLRLDFGSARDVFGCSRGGTLIACWCVSVDGRLRNTRLGWPIPWWVPCWRLRGGVTAGGPASPTSLARSRS
jgi:AcrR family transcriptional regulator